VTLSEACHNRVWRVYRDNPELTIGDCIRVVADEAGIKEKVASARYYSWRQKLKDYCGEIPGRKPLNQPLLTITGEYEKELDAAIDRLERMRGMMRAADRMKGYIEHNWPE
jgi:hypothetical protein